MQTTAEKTAVRLRWAKEHFEFFKAYQKEYRRTHKEQRREQERKWYAKNKHRILENDRIRRINNPEFKAKEKALRDKWIKNNPEKTKEMIKRGNKKSYEIHREERLNLSHQQIVNKRLEVIYWYSNGTMRCIRCGEDHIEFLAIDHINNNGCKEKKQFKGNIVLSIIRRSFPEGYQILCHNCNKSIGHYGHCPHKSTSNILLGDAGCDLLQPSLLP